MFIEKTVFSVPALEFVSNMSNVTNSEAIKNISITMRTILIVPELSNFSLLGIGLLEMYHGIEIGHPIYAILFVNLLVAFSSSFLGILSYFYRSDSLYIVGKQSLKPTYPVFR